MKRRVEDLQDYKQQFLKLETEFSEYVSEKNAVSDQINLTL